MIKRKSSFSKSKVYLNLLRFFFPSQDSVDKKPVLKKEGEVKKEDEGKTRVLVGVMRVGLLAKQLLLKYVLLTIFTGPPPREYSQKYRGG